MVPNASETKKLLRNELRRGLLFALLLLAFLSPVAADAQTHREWRDTTLPEMRTPRRLGGAGQPIYPIGLFTYAGDYNRPFWEVVPYLNSTGIDHIIQNVQKGYDGYRQVSNWDRYLELLDSLEGSNKRIVPLITYGGENNMRSYVVEAEKGREITFFPFDSSQMRRWEVYENLFTSYQYDSTVVNLNYIDTVFDRAPREVIYNPGSLAGQTVASGIAFDYKSGQTVRWNQHYDTGVWHTTANPINSTALFEKIDYGWRDTANNLHGDHHHTHRMPHYIVVTGHLFEGGTASDNDTLLRVNVWYEVDKGKVYRDSASIYRTADTNLRFLYKTVGVTRGELKPTNPTEPNWNEYREAAKRISFQKEGMGGPTDTGVTAQRFDLEVVYLGGEKLALRSLAVRDSITHLLIDPGSAGNSYRQNIEREIDTLVRYYATSNLLRPSIYNVNIADEPPYMQFAGFRQTKPLIEQSFIAGGTDTLTTLNGTALPFIQWLGDADWVVSGNYLANDFYRLGNDFNLNRTVDTGLVLYQDVPSVKQHNGGKWHIAELFDFDSLGSATYAATLPERIEHAELLWNHARMGAAAPGQELGDPFRRSWRVRGLYESAALSRDIGRPFQNYIGPISKVSISFQQKDVTTGLPVTGYDTNCDHRFERAELRTILRLGLAYGARGLTFYKLPTYPWGKVDTSTAPGHIPGHMLITEEIALSDFTGIDTVNNFIDWTVRNAKVIDTVIDGQIINDSLGVVQGLYTGFRSTYREIKESVPWIREMGEFLTSLRWRDAYSLHFQTDLPASSYDNSGVTHRPLPSDEIITSVKASHPITGKMDSAYATYVELGLFETKIDTVGGVRNYLKDTNYVFVVNRRMFETGNYDTADIPYSAGVKALLDTLSETRTISLKFNLPNPDSTQYSFIRVREVLPDSALLPLIGMRNVLDTVIYGVDSCALLTLGAGRAALLEVTYMPPDESIIDGRLAFNNQRKLIYGPDDRWHCVYLRNDSVLYRRSMKAGSYPGSILWEPIETLVSADTLLVRSENWFPSMTMRAHNGDTIVTVVWSCHSNDPGASFLGMRDVVVRDLNLTQGTRSNIWLVDFHWGQDSMQWGDVVVNAAHGGDIIAWGDSLIGVVARLRKLGPFGSPPSLSASDSVSWNHHACGKVGKWPSVPAFAHIASADSNCGIAYNQPQCGGVSSICYQRLQHVVPGGGAPGLANLNFLTVSPAPGDLGRPSIDQTQDVWERVQEGITWVEDKTWITPSNIWFRSMYTETKARPGWDSIEMTQGWGIAMTTGGKWGTGGDSWPNTGALNEVYSLADTGNHAHFSVAFVRNPEDPTPELRQGIIRYSEVSFKTGWPRAYAFWGDYPQASSSPVTQAYRHGVLYETVIPSTGPVMRSTRQFFGAKGRPTGYVAEGRMAVLRLSDSIPTGFTGLLHDVWVSDNDGGRPLELVARDDTERTDAVEDVEELLRTRMFRTHDSVEIGLELHGRFYGEASAAAEAELRLIAELVDSASGSVVCGIDSIEVTAEADSVSVLPRGNYDLLSGTYFVRVRMETSNLTVPERGWESDYPVVEYASYVESEIAGKSVRRLDGFASSAVRINAQPNPFGKATEIRFSVPRREYVTVTLYDVLGRKVRTLAERELYEAGRYAVELESGNLLPGTYLVELCTGTKRATEKILLKR